MDHILIVDDEKELLESLQGILGYEMPDCRVSTAESAYEALDIVKNQQVDLVLSDIRMPQMDGMDLLLLLKKHDPNITVILMTAHGTIELAVEALKKGAYDFFCKPFNFDELVRIIKKGLERNQLIRENQLLKETFSKHTDFCHFIGQSEPMRQFYANIQAVAHTNYTVLIRGASGTGKELTAKAIHEMGKRKNAPFVIVNCPAIPEHLLESELFGHKKGAFTGADYDQIGLFDEADKGSICLDEIGDIPVGVQTKLLRVLQEKEIKPLGGGRLKKINVRVLASTNQDLEQKIIDRTFREDLFYRLNVVTIRNPSLDEIREDIPLIANHLVKQVCLEQNVAEKHLTDDALDALVNMDWPGNVRQLQNTVRRAILFSRGDAIDADILAHPQKNTAPRQRRINLGASLPYKDAKEMVIEEFTHSYVREILQKSTGNVTRAAELSGLSRAALQKIMKRFSIQAAEFKMAS